MPPVREASTKPSAATVLPAPVACSNQKRRAAPGSSRPLGQQPPPRPPRPDPSRAAPRRAARRPRSPTSPEWSSRSIGGAFPCRCGRSAARPRARSACRTARPPGGPSASCRRPGAAPPRPAAAPARASARTRAATRRTAPSGPRRSPSGPVQRGAAGRVPARVRSRVLAFEHEGLSREFLGALQVIAGNRRVSDDGASLSHVQAFFGERGAYRVARQETAGYARGAPPLFESPASNDGPGPCRDAWRIPIEAAHVIRNGSAIVHSAASPSSPGARDSGGGSGDTQSARLDLLPGGGKTRSRRDRAGAGQAGRREQMGVAGAGPAGSSSRCCATRRRSARARSRSSA